MSAARVRDGGGGGVKLIFWLAVIASIALIGYLLVYGPDQYAKATGTVADGTTEFEVGGAKITPEAGWSVEGKVEDLFGPFKNWSVAYEDTGIELVSPDRVLRVEIVEAPSGDSVERAASRASTPVISETLASGAEVRHVDTGEQIVAVVEGVGDGQVMVRARVVSGELDDYRPAVSSILELLS